MVTYERWNQAIISHFFEDCEPGEIVFLQTNAETLTDIAKQFDFNVESAEESLKEAVRLKVVTDNRVNLLPINPPDLDTLWADLAAEEPSQVAFLALTVLAASLMETSKGVSHTNYYVHLNYLLFDKSSKGKPKGIELWQIKTFWKHLQSWARNKYNVELYLTTAGSSNRRYVWYPISQCLISKHNRHNIYHFFRDYNLTPFSDIPENQLEQNLRAWLGSSDKSVKIERYFFSNEAYKKSILNQVKSILERWDGEIPPEPLKGISQTTERIDVELRFDLFDNVEIRYWFRRRWRDEIDCETNQLEVKRLLLSGSEKWFEPIIDNGGIFWNLRKPLQLQTVETNPIIYTLGYSDIWIFREDPERDDGWLSRRNLQLYEDHLIVFRKQVLDYIDQTCELGIETLRETINNIWVDGKENGWCCLKVKPTKSVSFSDQELWRLSVTVNSSKQIRLIDGLSVKDKDGRRAYVNICLPMVFVPDLGLPSETPLQINKQELPIGKNRLVPLDKMLDVGVYQLSYGNKTKELRIIAPERSLQHKDRTLIASLSANQTRIPNYAVKEIAEISAKSGIWFAGAKFFGTDIPEVTWDDVQTEPQRPEENRRLLFKTPAEFISSVVKIAIELKHDQSSAPEWLNKAIEYLDQNVAMRVLVKKKLGLYSKTALSYADLRKLGG